MARFGIELIAKKDGYLPQNDFGSRFSAIACQLFLVPMAHFGIESIAKKDGSPSQNDFAPVCLYGPFRHRTYSEKDGYLPQNDFGSRFSAIACRL